MARPAPTTDGTAARDGRDGDGREGAPAPMTAPATGPATGPRPAPGPAPGPWSDLFALTVEFEVADADFEAFMALLRDNAARSVEAEPGCLRFDVLVPEAPQGGRTVLLYEIYVDRAAFDDHLSSDHYRRFDAGTAAMVRRKAASAFRLLENAKSPSRAKPPSQA